MKKEIYTKKIAGKEFRVEFNDLADQADGSVMVSCGNTTVLATATMSKKPGNAPFFPLTVDYEEKFYAAGQILGSRFMRREGRPSEEAILSARLIDRTIRPLFDHGIRNEIQIVVTVLSIAEDDPDILAILATSLALGISRIPWGGPVSAVRIGKRSDNEDHEINPDYNSREDKNTEMDLVICGMNSKITMIEAEGKETPEDDLLKGIEKAQKHIEEIQEFQNEIISKIGEEKTVLETLSVSSEVKKLFSETVGKDMEKAVFETPGKKGIGGLEEKWKETTKEKLGDEYLSEAEEYLETMINELVHKEAVRKGRRQDGRSIGEVRELYAEAGGLSEILHGSGIFYRGGTHVLSVLTLGGPDDALLIDQIESQDVKKRFMHHYNFPPFSVGETGRIGGFNRRMIGHGALAEKALRNVIPPKEDFPYTIRIVSEALSSNGSTSMASVCGSTLALMDGGVPIKSPVAGIAMGLMMDPDNTEKYTILTDIQGPEDHYGDMDLKVAGTENGINAIQMDTKLEGVSLPLIKEAIADARKALNRILEVITKEIDKPRSSISPNAPEIKTLNIDKDQIGMVIGPGGKTINEIRSATGTEIDIEEDGTIYIISPKAGGAEKAMKAIEEITHEYKKGETFTGEVVKITDFGAFVKIGKGTEGLLHISEIAPFRVENVAEVLSLGDEIPVIIKDIDEKERLKLSLKEIDPDFVSKNGKKDNKSKE